jgi:hypothetical protein
MFRKLSLAELIDAASDLESGEQLALVAAVGERLRQAGCDAVRLSAGKIHLSADEWTTLRWKACREPTGSRSPSIPRRILSREAR